MGDWEKSLGQGLWLMLSRYLDCSVRSSWNSSTCSDVLRIRQFFILLPSCHWALSSPSHYVPVYDSTSLPVDPLFFPPAWQTGQECVVPPAIMTSAPLLRTPTGMDELLWDLCLLLGRFVFVCLLRLIISSQSLW